MKSADSVVTASPPHALDRRSLSATDGGRTARVRTHRFGVALGLVALAGFLLRILYVRLDEDAPVNSDGVHYLFGARYLADGYGYINPFTVGNGPEHAVPDGVHPPLWTTLLSIPARFGYDSSFVFRHVAVLVGVGTVVVVGLAAREAFGARVGVVAAGLAAVYPNIWLYERELVSEPPALFFVSLTVWLTYRFRNRPGFLAAGVLGVVVALAALTRAELVLLAVLLVAPVVLLVRAVPLARRAAWLATAAGGSLLLILPWTAYNTTRFEAIVPLSAGLGATMTAGNCGPTYDPERETFAYYEFGCALLSPVESDEPSVADVERRQNALRFIADHKGAFVVTATARLGRAFSLYAPFQQVQLETERGTAAPVIAMGLWMYWLLLPFAIAGAVVARRRDIPIYPLVGLFVIVVLAVVPTIGAVRYRAPAEIGLVILAAVGITAALDRVGRRRVSSRGRAPGAVVPS